MYNLLHISLVMTSIPYKYYSISVVLEMGVTYTSGVFPKVVINGFEKQTINSGTLPHKAAQYSGGGHAERNNYFHSLP